MHLRSFLCVIQTSFLAFCVHFGYAHVFSFQMIIRIKFCILIQNQQLDFHRNCIRSWVNLKYVIAGIIFIQSSMNITVSIVHGINIHNYVK